MARYTSSDEFDLERRVWMTNEVPPYDMYKALSHSMQTDLWKWILGSAKVDFDQPARLPVYDADSETTTYVRDLSFEDVFLKMTNGKISPTYGPEISNVPTDPNFNPKYNRIEIDGVTLPEFDLLLHEVYRYLATLYPDTPSENKLLTDVEFNDAILAAGDLVNYSPDVKFFDKVASTLSVNMGINDTRDEASKLKIRNLLNNSFRRKLYGSKAGYRMFANDIFQLCTIFPVATYLPIEPITQAQIDKEARTRGQVNALNNMNLTREEYIDYARQQNRTIENYSSLYYRKFRLVDWDGRHSSFLRQGDSNTYFYGYTIPFNEDCIFEYPNLDDASSEIESVKESSFISNEFDAKGITYVNEILGNIFEKEVRTITKENPKDSEGNLLYPDKNKVLTLGEEKVSSTKEIHYLRTSHDNAIVYRNTYVYDQVPNILSHEIFDEGRIRTIRMEWDQHYIPGNLKSTANHLESIYNRIGTAKDALKDLAPKPLPVVLNPFVKDTLILEPSKSLTYYPTEISGAAQVSADGNFTIINQDELKDNLGLWGKTIGSTDLSERSETLNPKLDFAYYVNNFTKGKLIYTPKEIKTLVLKKEVHGDSRYVAVVENKYGEKIDLFGKLSIDQIPNGPKFDVTGATFNITAIPETKNEELLKLSYGAEYEDLKMGLDAIEGEIADNHYITSTLTYQMREDIRDIAYKNIQPVNNIVIELYKNETFEEAINRYIQKDTFKTAEKYGVNYKDPDNQAIEKILYFPREVYEKGLIYTVLESNNCNIDEAYEIYKLYHKTEFNRNPEGCEDIFDITSNTTPIEIEDASPKEINGTLETTQQALARAIEEKSKKIAEARKNNNDAILRKIETEKNNNQKKSKENKELSSLLEEEKRAKDTLGTFNKNAISYFYDADLDEYSKDYDLLKHFVEFKEQPLVSDAVLDEDEEEDEEEDSPKLEFIFSDELYTAWGGKEYFEANIKEILAIVDDFVIKSQTLKECTKKVNDKKEYISTYFAKLDKDLEAKIKEISTTEEEINLGTKVAFVCRDVTIYALIQRNLLLDQELMLIGEASCLDKNMAVSLYNEYIRMDYSAYYELYLASKELLDEKDRLSQNRSLIYEIKTFSQKLDSSEEDLIKYEASTLNTTCFVSKFGELMDDGSTSYNNLKFSTIRDLGPGKIDYIGLGNLNVQPVIVNKSEVFIPYETGDDGPILNASYEKNRKKFTKFNIDLYYPEKEFFSQTAHDFGKINIKGSEIVRINNNTQSSTLINTGSSALFENSDWFVGYNRTDINNNITVTPVIKSPVKIEGVIDVSTEGMENVITFRSDDAKERYKYISIGDEVFGPSLDTDDDNNIYVQSIGFNSVTVNKPFTQSGTFVLTFNCKLHTVAEDLSENMYAYKSTLDQNNIYSTINPFEHGLYGSSDFPKASNAILESLPDISFFKPYDYKTPDFVANEDVGVASFFEVMEKLHPKKSEDDLTIKVPSTIKFMNDLFIELNLNRLLLTSSRTGKNPILIGVDWLDYISDNLKDLSRATDHTNVGVNLMMETDSTGFYTMSKDLIFTDPSIQLKFITMNFDGLNLWNNISPKESGSWTVPAYAQIGTGGSGRYDWFKSPADITYPNIWGNNVFDAPDITDEDNNALKEKGGRIRKRSVWGKDDTIIDEDIANNSRYYSVEKPLFEIPLGEYDVQTRFFQNDKMDMSKVYTTIQSSFYQETFNNLTRYLKKGDDTFDPIVVNNKDVIEKPPIEVVSNRESITYKGEYLPTKYLDENGLYQIKMPTITNIGDFYIIPERVSLSDIGEVLEFGQDHLGDNVVFEHHGIILQPSVEKTDPIVIEPECMGIMGEGIVVNKSFTYDCFGYNILQKAELSDYMAFAIGINMGKLALNKDDVYRNFLGVLQGNNSFRNKILWVSYIGNTRGEDGGEMELTLNYPPHKEYTIKRNDILGIVIPDVLPTSFETPEDIRDWIHSLPIAKFNRGYYTSTLPIVKKAGMTDDIYSTLINAKGPSPLTELKGGVSQFQLPRKCITEGSYNFDYIINPEFTGQGYKYILSNDEDAAYVVGEDGEYDSIKNDKYETIGTEQVTFDITRSSIYKDEKNDAFYTFSDKINGEEQDELKKIAIKFAEQKYYKNTTYLTGSYKNISSQESGSDKITHTPIIRALSGIGEFNASTISSGDKLLEVTPVNLRSIWTQYLEPKFFSTYYDVEGIVRGLDENGHLIVSYNNDLYDKAPLERLHFTSQIASLLPVKKTFDSENNRYVIEKLPETMVNFEISEKYSTPTVRDAKVTKSMLSNSTVDAYNFEFKYFKNLLVLRASVEAAHPNRLIPANNDSGQFDAAMKFIKSGDIIKEGMALSPLLNENLAKIQVSLAKDSNKMAVSFDFTSWHASSQKFIAASSKGTLYFADNVNLATTAKIDNAYAYNIENFNMSLEEITGVSFDDSSDSWMINTQEISTKTKSVISVPFDYKDAVLPNNKTLIANTIPFMQDQVINKNGYNPAPLTNDTLIPIPGEYIMEEDENGNLVKTPAYSTYGELAVSEINYTSDNTFDVKIGPYNKENINLNNPNASDSQNISAMFKNDPNSDFAAYGVGNGIFVKSKVYLKNAAGLESRTLSREAYWKYVPMPLFRDTGLAYFKSEVARGLQNAYEVAQAMRNVYLDKFNFIRNGGAFFQRPDENGPVYQADKYGNIFYKKYYELDASEKRNLTINLYEEARRSNNIALLKRNDTTPKDDQDWDNYPDKYQPSLRWIALDGDLQPYYEKHKIPADGNSWYDYGRGDGSGEWNEMRDGLSVLGKPSIFQSYIYYNLYETVKSLHVIPWVNNSGKGISDLLKEADKSPDIPYYIYNNSEDVVNSNFVVTSSLPKEGRDYISATKLSSDGSWKVYYHGVGKFTNAITRNQYNNYLTVSDLYGMDTTFKDRDQFIVSGIDDIEWYAEYLNNICTYGYMAGQYEGVILSSIDRVEFTSNRILVVTQNGQAFYLNKSDTYSTRKLQSVGAWIISSLPNNTSYSYINENIYPVTRTMKWGPGSGDQFDITTSTGYMIQPIYKIESVYVDESIMVLGGYIKSRDSIEYDYRQNFSTKEGAQSSQLSTLARCISLAAFKDKVTPMALVSTNGGKSFALASLPLDLPKFKFDGDAMIDLVPSEYDENGAVLNPSEATTIISKEVKDSGNFDNSFKVYKNDSENYQGISIRGIHNFNDEIKYYVEDLGENSYPYQLYPPKDKKGIWRYDLVSWEALSSTEELLERASQENYVDKGESGIPGYVPNDEPVDGSVGGGRGESGTGESRAGDDDVYNSNSVSSMASSSYDGFKIFNSKGTDTVKRASTKALGFGDMIVDKLYDSTIVLKDGIIPQSMEGGRVELLLAFKTVLPINANTQKDCINNAFLKEYLNNANNNFKLHDYILVDYISDADRIYSYRETLSDTLQKKYSDGYRAINEDTNHIFYEYKVGRDADNKEIYSLKEATNGRGGPIALCDEHGLYIKRINGEVTNGFSLIDMLKTGDTSTDPSRMQSFMGKTKYSSLEEANKDPTLRLPDEHFPIENIKEVSILNATYTNRLRCEDLLNPNNLESLEPGYFLYESPVINAANKTSYFIAFSNEQPSGEYLGDVLTIEESPFFGGRDGYFVYKGESVPFLDAGISLSTGIMPDLVNDYLFTISETDIEQNNQYKEFLKTICIRNSSPSLITSPYGNIDTRIIEKEITLEDGTKVKAYYDDMYKYFPLKDKRFINFSIRTTYANSQDLATYTERPFSDIYDKENDKIKSITSVYLPQQGYGGERLRSETEDSWNTFLPWDIDPVAFLGEYALNKFDEPITLCNAAGEELMSNNGERIVKDGEKLKITYEDLISDTDKSLSLFTFNKDEVGKYHRNNIDDIIISRPKKAKALLWAAQDKVFISTLSKSLSETKLTNIKLAIPSKFIFEDLDISKVKIYSSLNNKEYNEDNNFSIKDGILIFTMPDTIEEFPSSIKVEYTINDKAIISKVILTSFIDTSVNNFYYKSIVPSYYYKNLDGKNEVLTSGSLEGMNSQGKPSIIYPKNTILGDIVNTTREIVFNNNPIIINVPLFYIGNTKVFTFVDKFTNELYKEAFIDDYNINNFVKYESEGKTQIAKATFIINSEEITFMVAKIEEPTKKDVATYVSLEEGSTFVLSYNELFEGEEGQNRTKCSFKVHTNLNNLSVKGSRGPIYLRKPSYNNFLSLIGKQGYVISSYDPYYQNLDSSSAVPVTFTNIESNKIFFAKDLSSSISNTSGNLDDGKEHFLRIRILPQKTIESNTDNFNDPNYFIEINNKDITQFPPDRVYFNPKGYPKPPVVLNNKVYRAENNINYTNEAFTNTNNSPIRECDENGNYIKYIISNGALSTRVLSPIRDTLNDGFIPPKPNYMTCQNWFEGEFYLYKQESNPFWQVVNLSASFDNITQRWTQNLILNKFEKVGNTIKKVPVTEDEAYLKLHRASDYSIIDGEIKQEYNADFLDTFNGIIRFIATEPSSKKYNKLIGPNQIIKYGICVDNNLKGRNYNVPYATPGYLQSSYTVNSTKNMANPTDSDSSIVEITEMGLFNKQHVLVAYAIFPPIEYRTDSQHVSFTSFIKYGACDVVDTSDPDE